MKSVLGVVILAVAVVTGPAQAQTRAAPDYTGELRDRGRNPETIVVHRGARRTDAPVANGGVASEYDAPGQIPRIQVFRDRAGDVTLFWIRSQPRARLAPDSEWESLGQQRVLAGETCEEQRRVPVRNPNEQRCVTGDGVVLAFFRDYGRLEMHTLERQAVDPREVAPPLELLNPGYWKLRKPRIIWPWHRSNGDYEAVFDDPGGLLTVKRRGAWTSRVQTGAAASTMLLNEDAGVRMIIRDTYGPELEIRSATKTRALYWPFMPRPAEVNGKGAETLHGETCHWQSRTISPDAAELECRTDDGALLAVGFTGPGGLTRTPARSFERKPVPFSAIMPDAGRFTPQRYGLP